MHTPRGRRARTSSRSTSTLRCAPGDPSSGGCHAFDPISCAVISLRDVPVAARPGCPAPPSVTPAAPLSMRRWLLLLLLLLPPPPRAVAAAAEATWPSGCGRLGAAGAQGSVHVRAARRRGDGVGGAVRAAPVHRDTACIAGGRRRRRRQRRRAVRPARPLAAGRSQLLRPRCGAEGDSAPLQCDSPRKRGSRRGDSTGVG
eukprot:359855-Chlamydomonas_euryale.AAC.2